MADTIGYPGGASSVIPLFELSGNLMVAYGRNKESFAVNRYSKVTPVKSIIGNYMRFNPLDLVRLNNKPQKSKWAPGTPRPTGFGDTLGFSVEPFRTQRYNYPINLDKRGVDVSSYPIMKSHTAAIGQRAMTELAYNVSTALTTTSNFPTTHVFSATTASGTGFLSGGTTADPRIKNAFDYSARIIMQDTFGAVKYGQLSVLMNNNTALKLSSTRELREYVMQQLDAQKNIKMRGEGEYNAVYGLPEYLYNYRVVVEDAYFNAYNKGNASEAGGPVFPDNTIVMFVADGDLEVPEGATSFATCHRFSYEEFTLETKDDVWDRIVNMSAVMDYDTQIVAPVTGCIIQNIFS